MYLVAVVQHLRNHFDFQGAELEFGHLANVTMWLPLATLNLPATFQIGWLLSPCAFNPDQPSGLSNHFSHVTIIQKGGFHPSQLSLRPKP